MSRKCIYPPVWQLFSCSNWWTVVIREVHRTLVFAQNLRALACALHQYRQQEGQFPASLDILAGPSEHPLSSARRCASLSGLLSSSRIERSVRPTERQRKRGQRIEPRDHGRFENSCTVVRSNQGDRSACTDYVMVAPTPRECSRYRRSPEGRRDRGCVRPRRFIWPNFARWSMDEIRYALNGVGRPSMSSYHPDGAHVLRVDASSDF